jgi:hypothetical protein
MAESVDKWFAVAFLNLHNKKPGIIYNRHSKTCDKTAIKLSKTLTPL